MSADAGAARFHHRVDVRFRDLDPMGHAHHTLPLVYLEEARARYWREVAGRSSLEAIDYVMAEVRVRYHGRIRWPGAVNIALRTARIGAKSLTMAFTITDDDGTALASGEATQVMYDYEGGHSVPVPDDLRAAIDAYERGTQS